jgi:hypothetical protein
VDCKISEKLTGPEGRKVDPVRDTDLLPARVNVDVWNEALIVRCPCMKIELNGLAVLGPHRFLRDLVPSAKSNSVWENRAVSRGKEKFCGGFQVGRIDEDVDVDRGFEQRVSIGECTHR